MKRLNLCDLNCRAKFNKEPKNVEIEGLRTSAIPLIEPNNTRNLKKSELLQFYFLLGLNPSKSQKG